MRKEIVSTKAEPILSRTISHRPSLMLSTITTGINQKIERPGKKATANAPVKISIVQDNKTPSFCSVLDIMTPIKKLSLRSHDTLMNIIESNCWSNVKAYSLEELNTLRQNPIPNISEFSRSIKQNTKTVYESLDILTREINGLGYFNEGLKRYTFFLEGLDLEDPEKSGFLRPVFSMGFMEDLQRTAFITVIPTEIYHDLTIYERTLARHLRDYARIQWSATNPEEYSVNVGTLFGMMNRPIKDANRRDKERIQKPFLKELETLYKKGIFLKEPYFKIHGTKNIMALKAAIYEPWKTLVNMDLVYKVPPPGFEETRLKNEGFKARKKAQAELLGKKAKAKDAKPIQKQQIKTVRTSTQDEESMDLV